MRMITTLATGAALALSVAANAQTPSPSPARPPTSAPQAPSAPPTIQSVNVVDISELPAATQSQVTEIVAQRGDGELQKLRSSVDSTPTVKSALEAKGLSSTHVLFAQMSESGLLTIVTKKAG
ncbi:hypothetical protein [Bosea psychrotolerans]|uniref:Uncharacterized protein n=1 Tax=Bosea psychrotolerans TaxID=1871628 RepID=A0A2S4LTT1_9HYPH|nr:hypothetical protein [Bosea psychrotolerans]POR45871.1 hypothetical protein CYD53_12941 [Bosea psychrotolerans]